MKEDKYTFTCKNCKSVFVDKKHRNRKFCSHKCSKQGSLNPQWRGDKTGYSSIHAWVYRHSNKPVACEGCKKEAKLDAANISGEYKRDLSDWEWLCRSCHMHKDNRINQLVRFTKQRTLDDKTCLICSKKFTPPHTRSKYCSRTCYYTHQRSIEWKPVGFIVKKDKSPEQSIKHI